LLHACGRRHAVTQDDERAPASFQNPALMLLTAARQFLALSKRSDVRFGSKNGPDTFEMERLYNPRNQTSVSYAADCDVIVCYGAARATP
jgi:hypothetical protein